MSPSDPPSPTSPEPPESPESPESSESPGGPQHYRLAPLVAARLLGAYLVLLALVVFVATAVVAVLSLPPDLLVVLLVAGVAGLVVLGVWLRSRLSVLTLDEEGYVVRLVRGAGVTQARWSEVEEAVASTPQGRPCVVLRLRDGRTTTIPVEAVAGDRDDLARDVRAHLRRAAGR